MEFKSPKWWKEFKALGRKHQASSLGGPAKSQAPSIKPQAIDETVPHNDIEEAQANEELEGLKRYVKNTKNPI
jgi:hypothetical protein